MMASMGLVWKKKAKDLWKKISLGEKKSTVEPGDRETLCGYELRIEAICSDT